MEKNPYKHAFNLRLSLKTKIWITVLTVVLLFAFFILFYFPALQESYILKNYNSEIQNQANTVSLGVKIALKEQDFEGVQTSFDFVKNDPHLEFVSLIQIDTVWDNQRLHFKLTRKIFKTYPENAKVGVDAQTDKFRIVKRSVFKTSMMTGEIMLAFNTLEIAKNKRHILITSIIVSLVVFTIGIFMGFVLAKNISDPVLRLRDAANRVSEGDLTQRVVNTTSDEIGELGSAFNKMVNDLGIARTELEQRSVDIMNQQKEIITQRDRLKETVTELKATQQQLIQAEKLASLGELTAGIAHEIQNPLNFVNNFSEVSIELVDELQSELTGNESAEIVNISNDIKQNLEKIHSHGKRADAIVKSMLQHSQNNNSDKKELTNFNELADEYLRMSYLTIRSRDKSFNCLIKTAFSPNMQPLNIMPHGIGRVLLNLFNNAFYAVQQKKATSAIDYEPQVSVSTSVNEHYAELRVRDNGTGIPESIKDKILEPFFTTKPTGEGTGLGLSLSYDILVKGHGGKMEINSVEGEYTEFIISIPRV